MKGGEERFPSWWWSRRENDIVGCNMQVVQIYDSGVSCISRRTYRIREHALTICINDPRGTSGPPVEYFNSSGCAGGWIVVGPFVLLSSVP